MQLPVFMMFTSLNGFRSTSNRFQGEPLHPDFHAIQLFTQQMPLGRTSELGSLRGVASLFHLVKNGEGDNTVFMKGFQLLSGKDFIVGGNL